MQKFFLLILTILPSATLPVASIHAAEPGMTTVHETFDAPFDAKRFTTRIPKKDTEVRDGVLWTRGSSGGKYPPMVHLPVEGEDLTIAFRFRHLGDGGFLWFFVDGDDGFGSVDHMLRVKLRHDGVQLQVDSHSKDPSHPQRRNKSRPADPVSKVYRLNEIHPLEKIDLRKNEWHGVKLEFVADTVTITLDGETWKKTLTRPAFKGAKRKLLWMQNGGEKGIEIDDIDVGPLDRSTEAQDEEA